MDPQLQCPNCTLAVTKGCRGCKDTLGRDGNTVANVAYCSVTCQREDWNRHKTSCKARQMRNVLYRSGQMVQRMWFIFRETVFDSPVTKATISGQSVVFHCGVYGEDDYVFDLPNHLFLVEKDKQAILSHQSSFQASALMKATWEAVLSGINTFL